MNTKTIVFISISTILSLITPPSNSLNFNVSRFGSDVPPELLLEGDAVISDSEIDLTHMIDYSCRVGRVVYNGRVDLFRELAYFTTHFVFTIDTRNRTSYGSGLAFFLAPACFPIPPNSAGGFLGLFNTTTGRFNASTTDVSARARIVSVEFDSFSNPEWDPPYEHVGIDKDSIRSSVTAPWSVTPHSGAQTDVWITYESRNLTVVWGYGGGTNSSLSYEINLREVLPRWVTVGITAATGLFNELHTIQSWEFKST